MQLIRGPVPEVDARSRGVLLRVDRLKLAKRLWRGTAEDGSEFGFELERPLRDGDVFWQADGVRYSIVQEPEPVLEVALNVTPSAAAGIGWAIGNLHMELSADASRLLAPDDVAVRQLLDRLQVPYVATTAVFRPGRFSRGSSGPVPVPPHELGPSHRH